MAARPVVTLYRRDGCALCDEAEALLGPLARRLRFSIEAVDIESDEALHRRYLLEIPVVAFAGDEIARAPLSAATLRAALEDALGRR